MKCPWLIAAMIFVCSGAMAQVDTTEATAPDIFTQIERESHGNIRFHQDSLIRELIFRHTLQNKQNPRIEGYRIRIYSDLGTHAREESEEYKTRFYENYPDIPVYREYVRPYYKVYVGDFRTKIEAIKSLKKIKRQFPSAFIIPDKINLPALDE